MAIPEMDLRDWFAGQALPAVITALATAKVPAKNWLASTSETAAVIAYEMADAILAARTPEQDR